MGRRQRETAAAVGSSFATKVVWISTSYEIFPKYIIAKEVFTIKILPLQLNIDKCYRD